jgi:hypothetical protein
MRQPGNGTFHGHPVIWIAPKQPGGFPAYPGDGERIGLDPRTHEPVADRVYSNGKINSEAEVLARKPEIAAGKYAFVVPNPIDPVLQPPAEFSATGADPFVLRARRALGHRPLWLGERFAGQRLREVYIGSTFTPPTGIQPNAAPFVYYEYGTVAIMEFASGDLFGPAGGPLSGRMTLVRSATSRSSSARIVGANMSRDGLFVAASKAAADYVLNRAGAIRLARALRPVPLP